VEDLERRAVQVLDDFVVRREALVDKGVQVLADRLSPVPVGNAEVAYGVFCEAVEAFAECLFIDLLPHGQQPIRRKGAIRWTRLSCRSFAANAVRLQLHALAYNLGNFLRTLATPEPIKDWSLTSLKEKLIKTGAKIVSHGRYVAFQMAEVAIPRTLFADVLRLIAELRPPPVTSTA
jgi:Transposase DDE domain group 1